MNFVISYTLTDYMNGLASVLVQLPNNPAFIWMPNQKPMFDVFDELQPSFAILHQGIVESKLFRMVHDQHKFKYGVIMEKAPGEEYADLYNSEDLRVILGPSISGLELDKLVETQPVANISQIHGALSQDVSEFECDVLVFTDSIPTEKLSLIEYLPSSLNVKMLGSKKIPSLSYLGKVGVRDRARAIAGAKVLLSSSWQETIDALYLGTSVMATCPDAVLPDWAVMPLVDGEDGIKMLCHMVDGVDGKDSSTRELIMNVGKHYHNVVKEVLGRFDDTEHLVKQIDTMLEDLKGEK